MKLKFIKSLLFFTIGVLPTGVVTPIAISSCGKKIPVTGVTLNETRLELNEGETKKLTATVLPENATNKNVTWSSSNKSIATVDKNGSIKAINEGNTTITVTTKDSGHTATCEVTVAKSAIHVTSVELDENELSLNPNDSYKLTATVLPEDATNKNATWSSSNRSAAIVDQSGNIKAISEGTATITVTTEDGGYTATCLVTVTEKIIPVTSVTLDKDKLELPEGDTAQLKAIVLPENATNKKVIWSSSDPSTASVDQNGNVTAIATGWFWPGTATITATTEDGGYTATCKVTVTEKIIPVTGVTLDKDKLELDKGTTAQLKATVLPENATYKNITWRSSNESVATVDQNGKVTAKSAGNATITVTTEDGGYTAYCVVTVSAKIPVTGVTLNETKLELVEGENAQLKATVLPANATNKNVVWSTRSTSDDSIATVDQSGNVKAVGEGTTTIHVTTEDGGYTAYCVVTVSAKIPVTGVTLNETKLELVEGETAQLIATVLPANATNKNVTWSSFGTDIATVDQNGKVTVQNLGGTRTAGTDVTVTTEDGNYKASCTVIVKPRTPVTGITLNETRLELVDGQTTQLIATILPEDATNKNVTWKSLDTSLATVDQNGNVTAKNPGSGAVGLTTITATTEDGGYEASCTVIVRERTPEPFVIVEDGRNYQYWGDILVKYKLLSNSYGEREALLLSKFNGDGENGYVDGEGILRIPDHVVYYDKIYYVKRIPSEWSDGSNNIDGIEFDNVSHLEEICDYAFKGTDALNNYHHKVLTFPEGLQYIGTEAFYNVNRLNDNVMFGVVFPSTLNAINVRAFANAGRIGEDLYQSSIPIPGEITFKGYFDPNNMREEAFSPIQGKNFTKYITAPTIELATIIANYISVCYEDDFCKSIFHDGAEYNYLIPMPIGW